MKLPEYRYRQALGDSPDPGDALDAAEAAARHAHALDQLEANLSQGLLGVAAELIPYLAALVEPSRPPSGDETLGRDEPSPMGAPPGPPGVTAATVATRLRSHLTLRAIRLEYRTMARKSEAAARAQGVERIAAALYSLPADSSQALYASLKAFVEELRTHRARG